jgi:hypothetical protein
MKKAARKPRIPRKTGGSLSSVPELEEWLFETVPKDEIVTCFYYEYARERADIRELVHRWREQLADLGKAYDSANTSEARAARSGRWDETFALGEEHVTHAFLSELAQLTDRTCAQLLINLPEFPTMPWQKIRSSQRAKWKKLLMFYEYLESIRGGLRQEGWDNVLSAIQTGDLVTKRGEIVPFIIDWDGGVQRVIDAFGVWAGKRWHELKRKKKSRDTYYESLKQLGVMRLKRSSLRTWEAVQEYVGRARGCTLYGRDHATWRKARLAASKRVKTMFPIIRVECDLK